MAWSCVAGARVRTGEAVHHCGGVALAFRPRTQTLTVAVTTHPSSGAFDELWTIDLAAGGAPEMLLRRPFASMFWDPAGEKLAFIVPSATGDATVSLQARTARGVPRRQPPSCSLTSRPAGFSRLDGRSHHSGPHGSTFLAGGRLPPSPRALGDGSRRDILRLGPERGALIRNVSPSRIGFFPPSAG